jgi:tetratricopeptide (TPR) repeat protein
MRRILRVLLSTAFAIPAVLSLQACAPTLQQRADSAWTFASKAQCAPAQREIDAVLQQPDRSNVHALALVHAANSVCLRAAGRWDEAEFSARKAFEIEPAKSLLLATILRDEGKSAECADVLARGLDADVAELRASGTSTRNIEVNLSLKRRTRATCLLDAGRPNEAIVELESTIRPLTAPSQPSTAVEKFLELILGMPRFLTARAHFMAGHFDDALDGLGPNAGTDDYKLTVGRVEGGVWADPDWLNNRLYCEAAFMASFGNLQGGRIDRAKAAEKRVTRALEDAACPTGWKLWLDGAVAARDKLNPEARAYVASLLPKFRAAIGALRTRLAQAPATAGDWVRLGARTLVEVDKEPVRRRLDHSLGPLAEACEVIEKASPPETSR